MTNQQLGEKNHIQLVKVLHVWFWQQEPKLYQLLLVTNLSFHVPEDFREMTIPRFLEVNTAL